MSLLPLELDHLTPDMVEKAQAELGETEEVKRLSLMKLRKLLNAETELAYRTGTDDDTHLLSFLRARKYNVEHAFNLLLNCYKTAKNYPELVTPDFIGLRTSVAKKIFYILPKRDNCGVTVIICRLDCWDYNQRVYSSILHDKFFIISFLLEYAATQVCGFKVIYDMRSITLGYVKALNPKYLILLAKSVKNCFPVRLKEVHVINDSPWFHYIWTVMKFVMSDKIRNRVHFHSNNWESLHKYISPDVLPLEYGGNLDYDVHSTLKYIDSKRNLYDNNRYKSYVRIVKESQAMEF